MLCEDVFQALVTRVYSSLSRFGGLKEDLSLQFRCVDVGPGHLQRKRGNPT